MWTTKKHLHCIINNPFIDCIHPWFVKRKPAHRSCVGNKANKTSDNPIKCIFLIIKINSEKRGESSGSNGKYWYERRGRIDRYQMDFTDRQQSNASRVYLLDFFFCCCHKRNVRNGHVGTWNRSMLKKPDCFYCRFCEKYKLNACI